MCLGEGVNEIHHYFSKQDWSIDISGRTVDMSISQLDMQQFTLQVWDKTFAYSLRDWIAFHQAADWEAFNAIDSLGERLAILEKKLTNHILSMAKGIGWQVEKPIVCKITDLKETHKVKVKALPYNALHLSFKSNVFLPNYIGLGGKVSLGFGTVQQIIKT